MQVHAAVDEIEDFHRRLCAWLIACDAETRCLESACKRVEHSYWRDVALVLAIRDIEASLESIQTWLEHFEQLERRLERSFHALRSYLALGRDGHGPTPIDVNRGLWRQGARGRDTNCVACAIATDNVLAGRPASALPSEGEIDAAVLEDHFGSKFESPSLSVEFIAASLADDGPGARGIVLRCNMKTNEYHVFNAIVESSNEVRFVDGQTGSRPRLIGPYMFRLLRTSD